MKKLVFILSLLGLLIWGFLSSEAIEYFLFYPPGGSVMNELRKEGDMIISQIDDFKNKNGFYPSSIQSFKFNESEYDGWRYKVENNGKSYLLETGNYEKYLFEIYWTSDTREWYEDR